MGTITVSFILPVYNVEKYIQQCLASILMQSLENYEIILVNDGSTDGSLAICREYEAKYSFVRVIDQPNSGVAVARNVGLNAAQGEYICFLDADDYYLTDFAKGFYDACVENHLDIIRGIYCGYDEETGKYQYSNKAINYFDAVLSGPEFLVSSISANANEVVPWLGFFRKDFLNTSGLLFPVGIGYEEDQIFFLQALLNTSCKIMQKRDVFYAYRQRIGSATKTPTFKQAQDVGYIVEHELSEANKIADRSVRNAAKCYAGSSFYQLTCIYGRISKSQRHKVRKICNFSTKLSCMLYATTKHQKMKNTLFTLCPWVVDAVYDWRNP